MNKYEMRTEKKKMLIIEAALQLFREKGFVAVSIKEIASSADVSQVSIYNYFKSKDALVKECINLLLQEDLTKARNVLHSKGDFRDKLIKAFETCTNAACHSLVEYFSVEARKDKIFLNLYIEGTKQIKTELYCDYIDLGRREGIIDSSISTESILAFMHAMEHVEFPCDSSKNITKRELEIQRLLLFGLIGR